MCVPLTGTVAPEPVLRCLVVSLQSPDAVSCIKLSGLLISDKGELTAYLNSFS